jgi:SAM-dependent methyltransferase
MNDLAGDPPLHELEPTTRFSDRAGDYVRFRPDYPPPAIACILEGLAGAGAHEPAPIVADVGAGTGIASRLLAARGARVIAVEPNAEMRAAAEPHPRVEWRSGTAEATGLARESVDLVLCAQAFHWFRQPEAITEFHRVLRPGGRLAILWNKRDRSDPLTLGYIEAIHAVNGEHPAEKRPFDPAVVHAAGEFTPAERHVFPHGQRLDRAGLLGRATSASYVPREGPGLEALARQLATLFERHRGADDRVTLRYRTEVWIAARS